MKKCLINNFSSRTDNGTYELAIPHKLAVKHVQKIAAEYGTLCVRINGITSRTSLYERDLDRTISRLIKNAASLFPPVKDSIWEPHASDELLTVIYLIAPYLREQWFELVGLKV